ncbi:MAG: nucleoside-diphosphate kinase [Candidatus Thorarchaeota archaeon]
MERSFVIIKPDGTVRRNVSALVVKALLDRGYKVRAFKEMKVSKSLAEMHYAVHKEKPFFPWLVDFITSANVLTMILEADNVIEGVREALGATFVQNASSDSLRGRYGIWAGINIAHASDGLDTARTEISLWKKEGDVEESDDAEASAWAYISKYSSGSADYTMDIRNIVKESIENGNISSSVLSSLEIFLGKDADGIEEKSISALANAIFDYIKEEVEKK